MGKLRDQELRVDWKTDAKSGESGTGQIFQNGQQSEP